MDQYNLIIRILHSNVNKNVQNCLNVNFAVGVNIPDSYKIDTLEYMNILETKFPDYLECDYQSLVDVYNNTIDYIRKERCIFEKKTALRILAYTAAFCELVDARFPEKSLDPFLIRCKMNCTCLTAIICEKEFVAICGFMFGLIVGASVACVFI